MKLVAFACAFRLAFVFSASLIVLSRRSGMELKRKSTTKSVPILQPMKDTAPTPDFNLATPDGKKLSLKDFRGKVVLLNFWASWCVPCREEMPAMEKLYQEYKQKISSSSQSPSKTVNKTRSISSRSLN